MIALDFGNCAFNGNLENYIMIVVAPKREFASMDEYDAYAEVLPHRLANCAKGAFCLFHNS